MSSSSVSLQENRPRVLAILVAGFIGFLVGQFLGLLLEAVGVAIAHYPGGFNALGRALNPPWWSNALGFLGIWTGFAAAIVYAYREGRLRPLPQQWVPRTSDAIYIVVGVAMQFIIDLLYRPFHFKSLDHPVNHLFKAAHGPSFVLLAIMTTLIAPVFEEWLFRGVIFRAIAEGASGVTKKTAVVLGVIISAVLFGAAHGELLEFAGLVLLGVVLAILVQRTQRLMPSYLAHAAFNATALVAVIAQRAGH